MGVGYLGSVCVNSRTPAFIRPREGIGFHVFNTVSKPPSFLQPCGHFEIRIVNKTLSFFWVRLIEVAESDASESVLFVFIDPSTELIVIIYITLV